MIPSNRILFQHLILYLSEFCLPSFSVLQKKKNDKKQKDEDIEKEQHLVRNTRHKLEIQVTN